MREERETAVILHRLLHAAGCGPSWQRLEPLSGDGSDRPFYRLFLGERTLLAAFSSPTLAKAKAEARAAFRIGRHLWQGGVPVPEIHAYDPESGALLFEDLGDRLLFHAALSGGPTGSLFALYRQAVAILADLQLRSRAGFQTEWCWDTPRYDRELMINRESNYFAQEFCRNFMGVGLPSGLEAEFMALAERVSRCPATFVIHRDYQSRNLMVVGGGLRVIDFQGARLGPLGYDLAALLNDPYVTLPEGWKEKLTAHYLDRVEAYISLDRPRFMEEYPHVALQRNLQVLGAYAFLVRERKKEFFRQYIDPALQRLSTLLAQTLAADYPVLHGLVASVAARLQETRRHHAR